MILDTLANMKLYECLGEDFKQVSAYLQETDLMNLEEGKHILEDGVYFIVQSYATKPVAEGKWEAHRKYIDIQLVLEGSEQIGYAPLTGMEADTEYDAENDFQLLKGQGSLLQVPAGSFCIFFPEDVHMPGLNGSGNVRKIVVKIPVR